MNVNLGGDRLGSGAKMNQSLHNYYRSTHNLSKKFQSSMAPGILYPCYVNIGLNGDKFDIDIESLTRTLPTQGPLFGSFKMQIDCFVAPIRLYHGVLHNNPLNIGLNMKNVKLPIANLRGMRRNTFLELTKQQVNPSNLWKYLGLSGIGGGSPNGDATLPDFVTRDFNGVPMLAYYDIFKNYYANKQETNAYVITNNAEQSESSVNGVYYLSQDIVNANRDIYADVTDWTDGAAYKNSDFIIVDDQKQVKAGDYLFIDATAGVRADNKLNFTILDAGNENINENFKIIRKGENISEEPSKWYNTKKLMILQAISGKTLAATNLWEKGFNFSETEGINISSFKLENIDKMREALLTIKMGEVFEIGTKAKQLNLQLPYLLCTSNDTNPYNLTSPLVGLCLKTYQSDLFNNWIKTETIDGANGISAVTRVDTTNGLNLDALNLAQKVYNMLNRIAISGGTYQDWQEAVYTTKGIRMSETPMYMGGYSSEIMFEEVISTAATDNSNNKQALGTLGGRGKNIGNKGGHIKFRVDEPSIIMCIASITPRITYSQGNKWYLTDLQTIDDLHKPALDGIGFQDLMVEQMCWTGTEMNEDGNQIKTRHSAGKTVAWINYMTDTNECFGDFAEDEGKAFMVLNRNYNSMDENGNIQVPDDITTYIQPDKFNYAFAYNELQAQNFWTEIQFDIKARRLMSAKQIPNL